MTTGSGCTVNTAVVVSGAYIARYNGSDWVFLEVTTGVFAHAPHSRAVRAPKVVVGRVEHSTM
jgi:hypothetical protein